MEQQGNVGAQEEVVEVDVEIDAPSSSNAEGQANGNLQANLIDPGIIDILPPNFIIGRREVERNSSSSDDEMDGFYSMSDRLDVDSDSSDVDISDDFGLLNQSGGGKSNTSSITNLEIFEGNVPTVSQQLSVMPVDVPIDLKTNGNLTAEDSSTAQNKFKLSNRPNYLQYCELCKKEADYVCQGCYRSAYCSEEHQKEKWNEHRRDCINYGLTRHPALLYRGPITIDRVDTTGKICSYRLKSKVAVPANEKILEEKPFLICPWPRIKIRHSERHCPVGYVIRNLSCFGCGKTLCFSWTRCDDCSLFLCSNKCLYIDYHKKAECKIIQQLSKLMSQSSSKWDPRLDLKALLHNEEYREFLYMDVMVLRFLLKLSEMRESLSEDFADEWSKLDLIWNSRPFPTTRGNGRHNKIVDNLELYFRFSYALLGGRKLLLWKLFSIIDMNSFPLELPYRRFRTLCTILELAGHSCIPNCHVSLHEPEMGKMDISQIEGDPNDITVVVMSGRNFSKGTTITFSYVPLIFGTSERRLALLGTYFLWCMCSRCVDPTECNTYTTNIKCPTCQTAMLIPTQSATMANVESELRGTLESKTLQPAWECRGSAQTKRSTFCRPSSNCPPLRHDEAITRMKAVEIAISKYSMEKFSRVKDLLIAVKADNQNYFYQSAILKISEDVIRGTFFPLPDILADDLSDFTDPVLTAIVLAKNMYQNYMKKINPGFNFEGFPIASLQLAENELLGRESGKLMYLETVNIPISKSRIRGLIRPNLSIII